MLRLKSIFALTGLLSLTTLVNLSQADNKIINAKQRLIKVEKNLIFVNPSEVPSIENLVSLNQYIHLGLQNNPALKEAFYKWKSSFSRISKEFSLPDPQFSYTEYVEEVETRVGPQKRAFSINQKIPFPDKLWIRKHKAFKGAQEAYYEFKEIKLNLIYKISDAYYEYAYLSKAILLMKENIKLLNNFESVTQSKYKSGMAQNQDLLKVQLELGKLQNDLESLQDLRNPLIARLNALLNLPNNPSFPWPEETLEDTELQTKYNAIDPLYKNLKKENPEILSLSQQVEKNRDALKLARREFFPDFTLGVTHIETGDALNPNTVDSGKDPLMVMLSVNVPFWFNRLNAGVQEGIASIKASENSLRNKENELLSQLALVHYKVRDSLRQSQLYKDALLPKATQALKATQSSYEGGKVDFLSLIDAQRVLLNFQLAYYRNNANFHQRLSELQSLLGEVNLDKD